MNNILKRRAARGAARSSDTTSSRHGCGDILCEVLDATKESRSGLLVAHEDTPTAPGAARRSCAKPRNQTPARLSLGGYLPPASSRCHVPGQKCLPKRQGACGEPRSQLLRRGRAGGARWCGGEEVVGVLGAGRGAREDGGTPGAVRGAL